MRMRQPLPIRSSDSSAGLPETPSRTPSSSRRVRKPFGTMSPSAHPGDVMVPTGDRRSRPRLEVVGLLWGALDILEPARVVDISRGGVLIESPVAVPPGSEQLIHLSLDGQQIRV